MTGFFTALGVFLLAHILPEPTGIRSRLINRFGHRAYISAYSLFSFLTLGWLIFAALNAPYIAIWSPGFATALAPIILMVFACILFAGAILRPNPLSLSPVTKPILPGNGILHLVRHPLLWALFLWAASHAIANGDLVAIIMFGALALFSLAGMKILERRAERTLSKKDYRTAMALAAGPVSARLKAAVDMLTGLEIIAGLLLYVLALYLHEAVIGVDPVSLLLP